MTTTLFTTSVSHLPKQERDEQLGALCDALHQEFPAYYVSSWQQADHAAAVFVSAMHVESLEGDAPIPAHINGWGHGDLTLKLVA